MCVVRNIWRLAGPACCARRRPPRRAGARGSAPTDCRAATGSADCWAGSAAVPQRHTIPAYHHSRLASHAMPDHSEYDNTPLLYIIVA